MPECGGCTLCCTVLPVPWLDKPAGRDCSHCAVGVGCEIFNTTIPEKCKEFSCAWRQMRAVHPALRPDRCGVVFEKIADTFFLGTGKEGFQMTPFLRRQISSFIRQGYSVVLQTPYGTRPTSWLAEGQTWKTLRNIANMEITRGNLRE